MQNLCHLNLLFL